MEGKKKGKEGRIGRKQRKGRGVRRYSCCIRREAAKGELVLVVVKEKELRERRKG